MSGEAAEGPLVLEAGGRRESKKDRSKKKRRRRRQQQQQEDMEQEEEDANNGDGVVSEGVDAGPEERDERRDGGDSRVFGVSVHRSDHLQLVDHNLRHPSVKVLLVNLGDGSHVKKSNASQSVAYYEEGAAKHILPLMTQPFSFWASNTLRPQWEELILFNEDFSYLRGLGDHLGIFFLVQDFVSMTRTNNQRETEKGWHDVAWAFLIPFPLKEGDGNTGRKVRLQLFKPCPRPKDPEDETRMIWGWWKKKRKKYSSSLYVTVQGLNPPKVGDQAKEEAPTNPLLANIDAESKLPKAPKVPIWSRLPGQTCKIPNKKVSDFSAESFSQVNHVRFSGNGRLLGVADASRVIVFEVPTWERLATLQGHTGTVYEVDFNDDSGALASASGDQTARVWRLGSDGAGDGAAPTSTVLEHPSFVYCVRFHPASSHSVLATGSYDKVVRIWKQTDENGGYVVAQELISHAGFVTALEFGFEGQALYSGDRTGSVNVWETIVGNVRGHYIFKLKKGVALAELTGYSIESLHLHPGGSPLVMIDLKQTNTTVMQTYRTLQGYGVQLGSCVTPCGGFVICGSQDGVVHVWNTDTGDEVYRYEEEAVFGAEVGVTGGPVVARAIAFHPLDHILSMAAKNRLVAFKHRSAKEEKAEE